jgi:hypothetical protein
MKNLGVNLLFGCDWKTPSGKKINGAKMKHDKMTGGK